MSSRRPVYLNPASGERCECPPVAGLAEFHKSLPNYAPTPLVSLNELATELGIRAIYVKDESNRFGLPAFKALGASWGCFRAIARQVGLPTTASLDEVSICAKANSITLIAATEGNHGRAVAFMARLMGIEARIFVPQSMDETTQGFITGEGARVFVVQGCYDMAVQEAYDQSHRIENALLIQDTAFEGYEDVPAWIVEGYSTMMNEAEEQLSQLGLSASVMVTPVGVGSLAHAVAKHCKSRERPVSVVVVEPDSAPCLSSSLRAGKSVPVQTSDTIMDGMNCGTVSSTAWSDLQRFVDASITVSSYESHRAVQYLTSKSVNAGPCGGASLAALLCLAADKERFAVLKEDSVVVLLATEGARKYQTPPRRFRGRHGCDGVGESEIADYLSAWLAHRDIEFHRVEPTAGRPSIVGVLRGSGGGKSIMFNGHIDTVSLSSYEKDPLSGVLGTKDGKQVIFGRGTLDMKGGLAAALAALASIKKNGQIPRGDIIVAAVSDEEDASLGTQDIIAAGWRADAAVVAEPTMQAIATAHKGFVWIEVNILGVAAHGSDPSAGEDAILHAGWFLRALEQYQAQLPFDDLLGQASMHCGLIRGGEEPSSYPGKCTITLEFRTIPAQTEESILKDVSELLKNVSLETPRFKYQEPCITMSRPTMKLTKNHPLVEKAVACASEVFGSEPVVKSVPFWCDAALLGEAGIPSIVFGPSGEGLHSKEEWVEVESLIQMEKTYRSLALDICG
ncbi:hypothetical protein N7448_001181 [Penicillium atrosanguineum]|nr:hypothetical protein N7448_001181 [Penicillium atrosanguineum]